MVTAETGKIVYEVFRQEAPSEVLFLEYVTMRLFLDAGCTQPVEGHVSYLGGHTVELQNGKLTGTYAAPLDATRVDYVTFKKTGPKKGSHQD